mmetsp:Transcript_49490/g.138578  ORF Transcript_49490/g.138578 Transcript_49490/m.138578 type:complete len:267 (-) Transcript_49490:1668-2468(-)
MLADAKIERLEQPLAVAAFGDDGWRLVGATAIFRRLNTCVGSRAFWTASRRFDTRSTWPQHQHISAQHRRVDLDLRPNPIDDDVILSRKRFFRVLCSSRLQVPFIIPVVNEGAPVERIRALPELHQVIIKTTLAAFGRRGEDLTVVPPEDFNGVSVQVVCDRYFLVFHHVGIRRRMRKLWNLQCKRERVLDEHIMRAHVHEHPHEACVVGRVPLMVQSGSLEPERERQKVRGHHVNLLATEVSAGLPAQNIHARIEVKQQYPEAQR